MCAILRQGQWRITELNTALWKKRKGRKSKKLQGLRPKSFYLNELRKSSGERARLPPSRARASPRCCRPNRDAQPRRLYHLSYWDIRSYAQATRQTRMSVPPTTSHTRNAMTRCWGDQVRWRRATRAPATTTAAATSPITTGPATGTGGAAKSTTSGPMCFVSDHQSALSCVRRWK